MAARQPSALLRLHALLAQRQAQPFAWGVRDCALFAADAVQAVTGEDPAADLRGTYRTCAQAVRMLRRAGGLRGMAERRLGPAVAPQHARTGDVVLLDGLSTGGEPLGALGIVWGDRVVAQGAAGLVTVARSHVRLAWSSAA